MATYRAEIDGQKLPPIEALTGDYRMVAVMAVALADHAVPCAVLVWCEAVLPDYGPYWYRVQNDAYGHLKVVAGL